MPVYWLDERLRFPSPHLADVSGVLAVGGDLFPEAGLRERLEQLDADAHGRVSGERAGPGGGRCWPCDVRLATLQHDPCVADFASVTADDEVTQP